MDGSEYRRIPPERVVLKTGWPRPTPTSNAGIVGHAYTTDTIVGHRSHLSCTPCAMPAGVKSTALAVDRAWWGQPEEQEGPHALPP